MIIRNLQYLIVYSEKKNLIFDFPEISKKINSIDQSLLLDIYRIWDLICSDIEKFIFEDKTVKSLMKKKIEISQLDDSAN
jgi:hypothetical protein